ncbi:MAG: hypothetical protein V7767_14100, partial [Leeuwenhoekiella sp.]
MVQKIRISFFILFLAGCNLQLWAGDQDSTKVSQQVQYDKSYVEPVKFDDAVIDEYKKNEAFKYIDYKAPDNWWTRFKQWLGDLWNSVLEWILGGKEASGILKFIITALPYLILIAVLSFIVWLFFKVDSSGSPLLGKTPNQ